MNQVKFYIKECFQETETRAFSLISKRNAKITLRNHRVDSWDNMFCVFVTMSPRALSQLETIHFAVSTEQLDTSLPIGLDLHKHYSF